MLTMWRRDFLVSFTNLIVISYNNLICLIWFLFYHIRHVSSYKFLVHFCWKPIQLSIPSFFVFNAFCTPLKELLLVAFLQQQKEVASFKKLSIASWARAFVVDNTNLKIGVNLCNLWLLITTSQSPIQSSWQFQN